jgi:hypothetical protein
LDGQDPAYLITFIRRQAARKTAQAIKYLSRKQKGKKEMNNISKGQDLA